MGKKARVIVVFLASCMMAICFGTGCFGSACFGGGCSLFKGEETDYQVFYEIYVENAQEAGEPIQNYDEWLANLLGKEGEEGESEYDTYVKNHPDYQGTKKEWLEAFVNDTLEKCTVTFDLNGGTGGEGFQASMAVRYGKTVVLPTPMREGYTFKGWQIGESSAIFTSEDKVRTDLELIAAWQINELTVTFLDNEGAEISKQIVLYGQAASAPIVPAEIGNTYFVGWDKEFTSVKENMTISAIYAYKTYTVTYDTAGGSTIQPQVVHFGGIPQQPSVPEKLGYTFIGWFIDSEYTTAYNFDYAFDEDRTLYAQMLKEYDIITTAEELKNIAANPDKKYVLANDINYKGDVWTPIENFSGTLDGNGYTISNLVLNNTTSNDGFIKVNDGTVKNLVFDKYVYHYKYTNSGDSTATAGIFVGQNNGTIANCELRKGDADMKANISATEGTRIGYLGGICGRNYGTVLNCSNYSDLLFNASVYSSNDSNHSRWITLQVYYGGIVGFNENAIEGCKMEGAIDATAQVARTGWYGAYASSVTYMGGIVGANGIANGTATIKECSSNIDVIFNGQGNDSQLYKYFIFGGVAGQNCCTIKDCSILGNVAYTNEGSVAEAYIGGAVGENYQNGLVTDLYADFDITVGSNLTNSSVGSLVGVSRDTSNITRVVSLGNITLAQAITGYGKLVGTHAGVAYISYYAEDSSITIGEAVAEGTNTVGESVAVEAMQTADFIYDILYWDSSVWTVESGNPPQLKRFMEE